VSDTTPSPHREETTTVDELAARRAAKVGDTERQSTADESDRYADGPSGNDFDDLDSDFDDLYDEPYEDDVSSRRTTAAGTFDPDSLESDPDVEPVVTDFDGDYLGDVDDDYR
jgi:hypothetical protein